MAYATPDQLRRVLARDLQHIEGTAAELTDPYLESAIDAAQAHIDARLAPRYVVPFAEPVPLVINQLAIAFGAWHADLSYRQSVNIEQEDPITQRYRWARDVLDRLARGRDDIPGYATGERNEGAFPVNPYASAMFGLSDFGLVDTSAEEPWLIDGWGRG